MTDPTLTPEFEESTVSELEILQSKYRQLQSTCQYQKECLTQIAEILTLTLFSELRSSEIDKMRSIVEAWDVNR